MDWEKELLQKAIDSILHGSTQVVSKTDEYGNYYDAYDKLTVNHRVGYAAYVQKVQYGRVHETAYLDEDGNYMINRETKLFEQ